MIEQHKLLLQKVNEKFSKKKNDDIMPSNKVIKLSASTWSTVVVFLSIIFIGKFISKFFNVENRNCVVLISIFIGTVLAFLTFFYHIKKSITNNIQKDKI